MRPFELINLRGAVRKGPTYADVARKEGVSATTVSFVMNGRAAEMSIPVSTRERVQAAAREIGYRPNRLASSLAHGRTSTIGVIVPRLESSFFANIVHGIQEAVEEKNCRILLGYSRHDPKRESEQVQLLLEHRVDALICLADEFTAGALGHWLEDTTRQNVPVVIIDEGSHSNKADCVVADDEAGAALAMKHLIDAGHKRIAHIAGPTSHSTTPVRLQAYRQALEAAGIPVDPDLIVGSGVAQEQLAPTLRELLSSSKRPDAIFAANDVRAARAIETMREYGLRHPADIEVIGFGNLEVSRNLGFSTIDQDPQAMGRLAAERAFARIEIPTLSPKLTRSGTRLLVREGLSIIDYNAA